MALGAQKVIFIDRVGWAKGSSSLAQMAFFFLLGTLNLVLTSRVPVNQWLRPDGSQDRKKSLMSNLSPSTMRRGNPKRKDELQPRLPSPLLLIITLLWIIQTGPLFPSFWPIILPSHWFTMKRHNVLSSLLRVGKANFVSSEDGAIS